MIKHITRLLAALILFSPVVRVPLAHAEGGLVFKPYWTYRTDAPVIQVETGDINGDGVLEVVALTADNWVYVLENDGDLAWRFETGTDSVDLLVADLDGDGQRAEIFVTGVHRDMLLSDVQQPVWTKTKAYPATASIKTVYSADRLDGDGRNEYEMLQALEGRGVYYIDSQTGYYDFVDVPAKDVWVGDVDGDGRPEIVPNPDRGRQVSVFEDSKRPAWHQEIAGEVGLVQGGDVDGDGQAEVVVLSASWGLFLLESDGRQIWHQPAMSAGDVAAKPVPGQLLVHDLDGDDKLEILALSPAPAAAVHVFDGEGHQIWQHPLPAIASAARLAAGDLNDDGQAEVAVTSVGQAQVYLLTADGDHWAEYRTAGTTGALDYADLNHDGWGEVIVGTQTGIQIFGVPASNQLVWRELWRSPYLESEKVTPSALFLGDVDGDGQGEVVAGSRDGSIYILAGEGHLLGTVALEDAPLLALGAGDVDGDGQPELAVVSGFQLHVLDAIDGQRLWTAQVGGGLNTHLTVKDLDGDNRSEILVGAGLPSGGLVSLVDGQGKLIWQQRFDELPTAISSDGGQILVGTQSGHVYRLAADGAPAGGYELGARVLGLGEGLAVTSEGRVYQLADGSPTLVDELGDSLGLVQLDREAIFTLRRGEASLATSAGVAWQGVVNGQVFVLASGDLNGDGQPEFAVSTDAERVHLFGLALVQLPLLTKPDLTETRTGYAYSVNVNDPNVEAVAINLEIWDPSAGEWLTQPALSLAAGQAQGQLSWEVAQPFDTWDSGQESRFRFRFSDGLTQQTTQEIPGPLTIPTTPWYVYYGQRAGLAALILLVPALGLLLYRRQRAYRRSPVGQAEATLQELQANPGEALCKLHDLARDDSAQLTLLLGLAGEAGETTIADLSEGFHLILTRPEVTAEGLRVISRALESLSGSCSERAQAVAGLYDLSERMLEANTVSRIVALRSQLSGVADMVVQPDSGLAEAAEAPADLGRVADALHNYQRVDLFEDKAAYLAQAIETLGRLNREFQTRLPQPERNVLTQVALSWLATSTNTLQDLQGRAQLEVSLKTRNIQRLEGATLSLELTNTGRSPASNLSVTLQPGQGYAASNGDRIQLDILPAGRSAMVELPVSAAPSVDQFRAEFSITFDDRERSGKRLAFADMVQLLQPAAEFQPISNPYVPGTPLSPGSPVFFGRDDLFEFIKENIAGLARQNILVLIGQRRTGKTSFLRQLPPRLGEDYLPIYLDGQSLGVDPGMANFFYDLALAVTDALADEGIEVEEPRLEDFQERPSGTFERSFLPAVIEAIGGRRLLLLFDEFEELETRVASGKLESAIFPFLRHLMQHVEGLGFIFVGTHRLEALSSDYWSIFFNIALYKHVAFLDEKAARELIVKPVAGAECGLRYDDLAVDKMLRVTAGHPYFLQLTCHALVNHANRERRGYLTIQDVSDVLGEMLELGEAHFSFLWEQSDPQERLVLAALNPLLSLEPTVTAVQVAELLSERGIAIEVPEVSEALRRLMERDIVRDVGGLPSRYEYKVELVRLWVERYKTLGRLVEEVG